MLSGTLSRRRCCLRSIGVFGRKALGGLFSFASRLGRCFALLALSLCLGFAIRIVACLTLACACCLSYANGSESRSRQRDARSSRSR